jgi:hypothetical protein
MPPTHLQLVILLAVPFAAAIVLAAIGRLTGRRIAGGEESESAIRGATWPARLAPPLAIALGPAIALAIGPLVLKNLGFPLNIWPREAFDWHLLAPVAGVAVGAAAVWLPRRFTALIVAEAGALLALCLSVRPGMTVTWQLWPAVIAPGILYCMLEPLARRNHNPAMPIILLLLAGAGMIVELDGTSALLGISCFPLVAATLGLLISYPLLLDRDLSRAAVPAFVLLWSAMLLYGHFWADAPWQRTILVAAAPLVAFLADIPPIRRFPPFWRATVRIILIAIPLAFAVVPAARDIRQQIIEEMQTPTDM